MLSNMSEFKRKRKSESQNLFSKKYKVSSETSTPSFNEKNEIYYQHNSHLYAKNEIIDLVDDDCLAAIFMYVPACERPKIALVCQKWKRVLDSCGNVKKLELTHWEYDEDSSCLKNYPTLDGQLRFLKSLLFKCGHYLTDLDLSAYGHCNIVPVINEYCPNLVKLRLRFAYVDNLILYDAFSRLSQLKVLKIIFQNFDNAFIPYTLIYSLRNVADTLTDLVLSYSKDNFYNPCYFPEETICVIRELRALRRFEIGGIRLSPTLKNYLTSSVQSYCNYDDYFKSHRAAKFIIITKLKLGDYQVTDDGLYTIANTMKQLKELHMHSTYLTNEGVVTISKMNLRILAISGLNNVIDSSSIKLLKNLRKVCFPHSNNITNDSAMKVLKNSPKMNTLFVMHTSVTVEFIKKAAKISTNRKRHLNLGVSFMCDKKKYESPYFTITIILD